MKKIRKVQADLPSSASEGSMFYSRGSRKVRIFKGGSYTDYSAWEFILNDSIDVDGDGIFDYEDPDLTDGPLIDSDGDGILNGQDNHPNDPSQSGVDADGDGVDAAVDPDDSDASSTGVDADGDGVDAAVDPDDSDASSTGVDADGDGVDDAIDTDSTDPLSSGQDADNDGVDDAIDADPTDPLSSGQDADNDGVDDAIDTDPTDPLSSGQDADNDGVDDAIDADPTDPLSSGQDADNDGVDDAIDTDPTDPLTSGQDADNDGVDDALQNSPNYDRDGDGVINSQDNHPDDPSQSGVDADNDGVDDAIDIDATDPSLSGQDTDLDGIDNAVDDDSDNDGYSDDIDADPTNPFVFTGDIDGDGIDATIDPDDQDSSISIFVPTTQNPYAKAFMDYKYPTQFSTYYNRNVPMSLPPEAQGSLLARSLVTSANDISRSPVSDIHFINSRTSPLPSTYTTENGDTGSRDDYDPYPTVTQYPQPIFFTVSVPRGIAGWNQTYHFEFYILPTPYFSSDGQIFSNPFEWAGYYPLYGTENEAKLRSSDGTAHSHTFSWDAGSQNDAAPSVSNYPMWLHTEQIVTKTFYMPNGLTAATTDTPERQYLTHYWHGNHPGLPVWSQVQKAGNEIGSIGYYPAHNGKAFEWIGPQNGAGQNLTLNSTDYGGNHNNLIFPPAIKSLTLTAIKQAIPVTVT